MSKTTRLADFMPYRLSVVSNTISDLIADEYRAHFGLKIPDWRVMAVLGDVGSATQRELVAATRMDKVAVNRATKALSQRDLVRRDPNDRDGRSHHLTLTDIGRQMHSEIMPLAIHMEKSILAALDDGEKAELSGLVTKLLQRADEIRAGKR